MFTQCIDLRYYFRINKRVMLIPNIRTVSWRELRQAMVCSHLDHAREDFNFNFNFVRYVIVLVYRADICCCLDRELKHAMVCSDLHHARVAFLYFNFVRFGSVVLLNVLGCRLTY